ncbi:dihydrolipoyl dehydrogenase [Planctomicrobium piriforme]|uniref:Dihydrolipoyl dehydrogenase n=1 Tax=Planctomicrobium piriforme TaxID=1576369 RepID=A0A1I3QGE4_9PLAN|nr:dihydrolipoyl dehydrogenase [Planctomicrobium piriforme]SFJ33184.1 dihydrolipoamide dehydrogenase [Planctomicrobium piriforme]
MASETLHAEVVVLGGGPGGYPAAFEAADHGKKVIIIDQDPQPGGVCLNRGCIPSKALLHVAALIHEAKESAAWGLTFAKPEIDLDKIRGFKNSVIGKMTGGIRQLCDARKVQLIQARGTFENSNSLKLSYPDGTTGKLTFDHCIVAVGSRPAIPKMFDLGDDRVMDSTGALELKDIPETLLIVGGGIIGLELGSVYAALGSKVTVVEMLPDVLPGTDRDLVAPLKKRLLAEFAAIYTNTKVLSLKATEQGIVAEFEGEGVTTPQTFSRVLVSIGRIPNGLGIGLEKTKAKVTDRGFVEVDKKMCTADPKILAIGDVAGNPMLAHKATREAKVAVGAILGEPAEFDSIAIPSVVYTDPEIAWCGLTETQAKEKGIEVIVTKFPWAASGRAQAIGRPEGLTKMIVDPKTQRILGVGIVGVGAGELIAEGVLAVETAAVARDLAESIHAHPTLSETLMESAEAVFAQATHRYLPKKK